MSDPTKKETSLAPMLIGAAAIAVALVFAAAYFLSASIKGKMAHDVPHLGPLREGPPIHDVFPSGMYPSALPVNGSAARIAIDVPTSGDFRVVTAEFETHDEMDDVAYFYRKQFAKEAEESREPPGPDGKPGGIRWTLKDPTRIVLIKEVGGRPHIRLVWMGEDQP
jgi:hypothetical protein